MAIAVGTTRQNLADRYGTLGSGSELPPARQERRRRQPTNPQAVHQHTLESSPHGISSTGGTINGTAVTIDVPASTITHILLASAATMGAANMIDTSDVTDIVFSAQGQAVVTPTFTIT